MHKDRGQRGRRFGADSVSRPKIGLRVQHKSPRRIKNESEIIDESKSSIISLSVLNEPQIPTCLICGTNRKSDRFHRDHDHRTGMVRGVLCEKCNSYLVIYEHRERHGKPTPKQGLYRGWADKYRILIDIHLSRNTEILYIKNPKRMFAKLRGKQWFAAQRLKDNRV